MLKKLTVKNYALVDRLELKFEPGLTVITGETGAGKSVIIGSLLLALGERADRDLVRHGEKKASVSASFDIGRNGRLKKSIESITGKCESAILELGREISVSGSSRGFVNNKTENVAKIREISSHLTDFHSQQGQRHLLETRQHLYLLDCYIGITDQVAKLGELYREFQNLEKELADVNNNAAAYREKLELVNFQIEELSRAEIKEGEEEELTQTQKRLESVQTLLETGQTILDKLSRSDKPILDALIDMEKDLSKASAIDSRLTDNYKLISESVINLEETARNLEAYLSGLEDDPQKLETINARLAELYRLRMKYHTDEIGLLELLAKLKKQSGGSDDLETVIRELTKKLSLAKSRYHKLALDISKKRGKAAEIFGKKIVVQLVDLAIEQAQFKIEFQSELDDNGFELNGEKVRPSPSGLETAEFFISTNPKEPLKPMIKIASGGELSRIMLALLSVISGKYKLPTIIFDEIDTGIGGQTAKKLAIKLKELSQKHQLITISHLPAVASAADHHLAISKILKGGRNIIEVNEVKGAALKKELKRMAG